MKAFTNKGRYKRLMSQMAIKVIMNQQTALLGAASVAGAISKTVTSKICNSNLDSLKKTSPSSSGDIWKPVLSPDQKVPSVTTTLSYGPES
jgi:hypothetical protein